MATFEKLVPDFDDRLRVAMGRGLLAAGYVLQREVKVRLAPGYTSGDFVTGRVFGSVEVAGPEDEDGEPTVRVGSPLDYALFWEVGHQNLFTRRFERQERWGPALYDTLEAQGEAFRDAFLAALESAG